MGEVEGAPLPSLAEASPLEALLDGKSVSLGDLGSLHTTIKSKGAATAKDFEPKLLRNIMIRWVRPTRFRAAFDLEKGKVRVQKV